MLAEKKYSRDPGTSYNQSSIIARLEAFFLNNVGLVVTREQIIQVAKDPKTKIDPENWHQRLSELRTDKGYTILSSRDSSVLSNQEYVLASIEKREAANRRVRPSAKCWNDVLIRANGCCEWQEDGQNCGLRNGSIDPIGGGTVKLTPDHVTPHSINPNTDINDPSQWNALCGRHQVMKKNFWDGASGKINVIGILQSSSRETKKEAYDLLKNYFK